MGSGVVVGGPRIIVAKSMFRVEIDGIGNLRCSEAASLKLTNTLLETDEGGARTTVQISITGYKYDPISVGRPLTENMDLAEWADALKQGKQDLRNGAIYAMSADGRDLYRWNIQTCTIADYDEMQGDGKSKEEAMMEKATLRYLKRDLRVRLQ